MDEKLRLEIRQVLEEVVSSELRVIVAKLDELQRTIELSRWRIEAGLEAYQQEQLATPNARLPLQ